MHGAKMLAAATPYSCQCDSPDAVELAERDGTFCSCGVEDSCCAGWTCRAHSRRAAYTESTRNMS